eukprot:scaffold58183_cov63-Phaeocystis_antarctica.AAC.2
MGVGMGVSRRADGDHEGRDHRGWAVGCSTNPAATRTLARRCASRSRFTWLCLYEVELLGELEAERLRDVWGSLSSGCGCHLTPAPLKNFHYIKEISRLVGGLALI